MYRVGIWREEGTKFLTGVNSHPMGPIYASQPFAMLGPARGRTHKRGTDSLIVGGTAKAISEVYQ